MKRSLPVLLTLLVVGGIALAEIGVRRSDVPMDRLPWELAEPRLTPWRVWWDEPHIPIDHPFWWTLTDEITPAQLKQRLEQRRVKEVSEYQAELKRVTGESSTEPDTTWMLSGSEHPELFSLWKTFDSFAFTHKLKGNEEPTLPKLVDFGISREAAEAIIAAAEERNASDLGVVAGKDQEQMHVLLERAREQIGRQAVEEMRWKNDFARLSGLVGWSQEALRDLALRSRRNWRAEASIPVLVALRQEIGEEQWQLFRRFLLSEVAPHDAEIFWLD